MKILGKLNLKNLTSEFSISVPNFSRAILLKTHSYGREVSRSLASMKHQSQTQRLKPEKPLLVARNHNVWMAESLIYHWQVPKFYW